MLRSRFIKKIRNLVLLVIALGTSVYQVNKSCETQIHDHIIQIKSNKKLSDHLLNSTLNQPYVSGTSFFFHAKYVYTEHYKNVEPVERIKNGDVIFVRMLLVNEFFTQVFPKIKKRIILVTHNYDESTLKRHKKYLLNSNLLAWFSSNPGFVHPKHIPIPIGFQSSYLEGYTSLLNRLDTKLKQLFKGRIRDSDKVSFLRNFDENQIVPWKDRKHLLYINFNVHKNDPGDRENLVAHFKGFKSVLYIDNKINYSTYMKHLANSKYVLCPQGYGLDSFRYYETILMGAIPVVRNSSLFPIYKETTTLVLPEYIYLTEYIMENPQLFIKNMNFSKDVLLMDYWINKIDSVKNQYSLDIK